MLNERETEAKINSISHRTQYLENVIDHLRIKTVKFTEIELKKNEKK